MSKAVVKILNLLSIKVIEKYKPVIIGVFDDGGGGEMIKEVLKNRYDVHLSGNISEIKKDIPLAVMGVDSAASFGEANALAKGVDLAFRQNNSYPNAIILQMDMPRLVDVQKMLEIVQPDIVVFGVEEAGCDIEMREKKIKNQTREKAMLFRCLRKKSLAVFSSDDEKMKEMALKGRCSKMTFGFNEGAMVRGKMFKGEQGEEAIDSKKGTSFKITYRGTIVPFHFSTEVGDGQVYSALSAAAVGLHLGSNLVEISEALRK